MNEQELHQSRLQALGFANGGNSDKKEPTKMSADSAGEQDKQNARELQEIRAESALLQVRIEQVTEHILALKQQTDECEQTKRFLQSALAAADDADLLRCAVQTQRAIEQQEQTMQRSQQCESDLIELRDESNAEQRTQIDQFLARLATRRARTTTRTARPALRTEIQTD